MKKSIVKNYLYNLSYQLLVIILPLITTPYVSRVLGPEGIGAYSFTNSITQYFILFGALGLNLYGQREIAYKQSNKKEYSKLFYEIFILKTICLSLSIVVFYLMASNYTRYSQIFYIQIIDIVAAIFDISWLYQGLEDFKRIVIRNFLVKILGVILIFLFVKSPSDLYIYVLCYSGTLLLGNLSMFLYLPNTVTKLKLKDIDIKKHAKPAFILFIPQISISLYTLLDKTMIGLITSSDAEVGYYEQSQKIIKLLLTIITSLGTVMMPRIANIYAENNSKLINKYMVSTFSFVFLFSLPICFGIVGIANDFVPWFFGEGYDKVIINMIIISPIIVFIGLSNVIGTQYLLTTGKQKYYTKSVILGSIVNFFLNILFIPNFLSYGAAFATVCAECVVTLVQIYSIRNDFNIKYIFRKNLKYLLMSIIMLVIVLIEGYFLSPNIISTVIQVISGIIIYIVLFIFTKDENVFNILKKISKHF